MDGIFGVGLPEMLIVALVIFIIGGPTNTAKWARDLGRMIRKARETWLQIVNEIEKDSPGTKEFMNTAAEISQEMRGLVTAPQRMVNDALRIAETSITSTENKPSVQKNASPANGKEYPAWLPPDDLPKP